MQDLPRSERPRERLVERGAEALSNAELIAILLRTGTKGVSALDAAATLLRKHNHAIGLLAQARLEDIQTVPGIGRDKAATLRAAFALARRMAEEVGRESPLVDTPELAADIVREMFRDSPVERLLIILLNTRRRLLKLETIASGSLDTLLCHPREVFRPAILANAHSVIMAHNHPSGDPTPSEADIRTTREVFRAGQLLRIELVDHVIVGRATEDRPKDFVSLRQLGFFHP